MNKSKSHSASPAEERFVSSLPLEEAVKVLSALADDDTPVSLTEVNPDTWRFAIGYYRPGQRTASVTVAGVMRRWQGTYTRLNYTSLIAPLKQPNIRAIRLAVTFVFVVLIGGLYALRFIPGINPVLPFVAVMVGVALFVITLGIKRIPTAQEDSQAFQAEEQKQRHIRDMLFHDIVQVFKLAGDVSQDEDGLNASDDPGMEAVEDKDPFGQYSVIRQRK